MQENDALQIQLRKHQDTLKIVGLGVIAFGVWSIVKTILSATSQWSSMMEDIAASEVDVKIAVAVILLMTAAVLAVDITIRLYIGQSAIAEGNGERRRGGYIAVTFVLALLGPTLTVAVLASPGIQVELNLTLLASLFVELTSTVTALEMCWSALRIRKLRRQLAEQG